LAIAFDLEQRLTADVRFDQGTKAAGDRLRELEAAADRERNFPEGGTGNRGLQRSVARERSTR
jgi:hypothetical protein